MAHRRPGPGRARAAGAPPYSDRVLGEEVLYLHSLWRQGPPPPDPAPAPRAHVAGGSFATRIRAERRQRRRLECPAEPEDPGSACPLALSPTSPPASPASRWPVVSSIPARQSPPLPPGSLAQRAALHAADEFFSRHASRDDEEGSDSESDDEEEEEASRFFMGLFERDAALRGYYERRWEEGEFLCMGCTGKKARKGKCRKFHGCLGLVQHAHAATRCGRPRAHRALTAAICRVLGWDMERLPSIVIDPRGTLGQALAGDGAAAHVTKEDVDTGNNAVPLSDGKAVKKDVDTGKSGPSSNDNAGEAHVQEKDIGSAEKEDTEDIDPPRSKDIPKEVCKTVQEEEVASENEEHANNGVRTRGDDSANLGNNPIDSPKVYSCTHGIWTSRMEILD